MIFNVKYIHKFTTFENFSHKITLLILEMPDSFLLSAALHPWHVWYTYPVKWEYQDRFRLSHLKANWQIEVVLSLQAYTTYVNYSRQV